MSSDDAGNRWVGPVPYGESKFNADRQARTSSAPFRHDFLFTATQIENI